VATLAFILLSHDLTGLQVDGGANPQAQIDLFDIRRPLLPLSDQLRTALCEHGEQVVDLMVGAIHVDTVLAAMHYVVWENVELSQLFIRRLLRRLAPADGLKSVLDGFTRLLSLSDSLQGSRIAMFLEGDGDGDDHPTHGFLALAEQLKEKNPRKTYVSWYLLTPSPETVFLSSCHVRLYSYSSPHDRFGPLDTC
jgi:hypothetical protein